MLKCFFDFKSINQSCNPIKGNRRIDHEKLFFVDRRENENSFFFFFFIAKGFTIVDKIGPVQKIIHSIRRINLQAYYIGMAFLFLFPSINDC